MSVVLGESGGPKVLAIALLTGLLGCGRPVPPLPSDSAIPEHEAVPIMGPSRLSAEQLAAWFSRRTPQPSGTYAATVPLETMTRLFVEEGLAEGVAGDVAFVQSVLETGWFRFGGVLPASFNNFAGIGATGTPSARARFPDARTGVRAQIQHLRAYADASASACARPPLSNPCVDPRFDFVVPKGKAPTWNQLGSGNWATARTYGARVVSLYSEARVFNGARLDPVVGRSP